MVECEIKDKNLFNYLKENIFPEYEKMTRVMDYYTFQKLLDALLN